MLRKVGPGRRELEGKGLLQGRMEWLGEGVSWLGQKTKSEDRKGIHRFEDVGTDCDEEGKSETVSPQMFEEIPDIPSDPESNLLPLGSAL